jgi:hypothetical protein
MLIKVRSRGSTAGQANAYSALSDLPHALPLSPQSATHANRDFCAGEYYVCNLLKLWFAQGFEPMTGIEPVPRVHGWSGEHLIGSIRFTPRTPPLARIGYACKLRICAGEYYIRNLLKPWFVQGFEPMTGIKPGNALLLANANTTKPLLREPLFK